MCEWLELEADGRDGQRTSDLNPDFACPADAPRRLHVSISPKDGVVEGKTAVLTCESDANPPTSHYNWFDGNNQDLHHYGQMLRLEPVKPQHAGSYWCRGTNRLGQSQSPPTTLTVYCKAPSSSGPGHSWGFLLGCAAVCSDHIPDPALRTLPLLQGADRGVGNPALRGPCSTHSSSTFLLLLSLSRLKEDSLSAYLPPSRHPELLLAPSLCLSLFV